MIKVTPVELPACPAALQSAVEEQLLEKDSKLLSITLKESTPFKDKNIIDRQYRAIINRMNLVSVLCCYADGDLRNQVSTNTIIWGDILEILRTAPKDSSLAELWNAIPEQIRKRFSL